MNEAQKIQLANKRLHLQMQLQARRYIYSGVQFYWLSYFNAIKQLGLQYYIESVCQVTVTEQPYFIEAILALNNPDLKPEMIIVSDESVLDRVFKEYPSTSNFKYVMDLPLLDACNLNTGAMLQKAQDLLQITDEPVYFFSADCSPILLLKWKELLQYGNEIFDDSFISLIFTNKEYSWIIFRSIECEWRCGSVIEKNSTTYKK